MGAIPLPSERFAAAVKAYAAAVESSDGDAVADALIELGQVAWNLEHAIKRGLAELEYLARRRILNA